MHAWRHACSNTPLCSPGPSTDCLDSKPQTFSLICLKSASRDRGITPARDRKMIMKMWEGKTHTPKKIIFGEGKVNHPPLFPRALAHMWYSYQLPLARHTASSPQGSWGHCLTWSEMPCPDKGWEGVCDGEEGGQWLLTQQEVAAWQMPQKIVV